MVWKEIFGIQIKRKSICIFEIEFRKVNTCLRKHWFNDGIFCLPMNFSCRRDFVFDFCRTRLLFLKTTFSKYVFYWIKSIWFPEVDFFLLTAFFKGYKNFNFLAFLKKSWKKFDLFRKKAPKMPKIKAFSNKGCHFEKG